MVDYEPSLDWQSTSPIVKIFIDEFLSENVSDLCKTTFKNMILLGSKPRNYKYKPQSCYFISCIIKYLNNNSQILQFLSSLGIGVTSRAVENLEKTQIGEHRPHTACETT